MFRLLVFGWGKEPFDENGNGRIGQSEPGFAPGINRHLPSFRNDPARVQFIDSDLQKNEYSSRTVFANPMPYIRRKQKPGTSCGFITAKTVDEFSFGTHHVMVLSPLRGRTGLILNFYYIHDAGSPAFEECRS
jgi:hypothetical protein